MKYQHSSGERLEQTIMDKLSTIKRKKYFCLSFQLFLQKNIIWSVGGVGWGVGGAYT
jgi:hypothetical protein